MNQTRREFIAQILYQDTFKGALEEAKRATHAGWSVYLLGDGQGNLATIRGTPKKLDIVLDAKANGAGSARKGTRKSISSGCRRTARR